MSFFSFTAAITRDLIVLELESVRLMLVWWLREETLDLLPEFRVRVSHSAAVPQCLHLESGDNHAPHTSTVEHYSATKKKERRPFIATTDRARDDQAK